MVNSYQIKISMFSLPSLVFAFFLVISHPIYAKPPNCSNFDDLFNELTVVSSDKRQMPTNIDEFVIYCKKNNELANEIGPMIKKCFNETMRNIASLMLYSYRSRTKILCKNKNSKRAKEWMEAGSCINQYQRKISTCIDNAAYRIEAARSKPNDLKFSYMCCESVTFMKCIDKIQSSECKDKISAFAQSAQSLLSGFVDQSCGEYNGDTDKCDQLAPLTSGSIKKGPRKPSLAKNAAALIASIEA